MSTTTDPSADAGWHRDPSGTPQARWWDGVRWTDRTAPLATLHRSPVTVQSRKALPIWLRIGGSVLLLLGFRACVVLFAELAEQSHERDQAARAAVRNEVNVVSCAASKAQDGVSLGAEARGTVTNGSSKRSSFVISLAFEDPFGRHIDTTTVAVSNVAPGKQASWASNPVPTRANIAGVTCRITDVRRHVDRLD